MGQTLPNGIYLPAEGERNCYDGLEGNWRSLDGLISTVAGKASATHTHGSITNDGKVGTAANKPLITGTGGVVQAGSFGNVANTFCEGNDSRLSDARTPVAHTHTKSDVTDLLNSNFIPRANNSYDLGSSSYQWNNAYIKSLTINGVACGDILTHNASEFVGVTGNQTIGGVKTFTSPIGIAKGSGDVELSIKNTSLSLKANTNSGMDDIRFADKDNLIVGGLRQSFTNSKVIGMVYSRSYSSDGNSYTQVEFTLATDNQNGISDAYVKCDNFYPNANATINLGTSTNKWKSLNGINPGALSLPDYNNVLDVTSEIPIASLDGNTYIDINDYLPNKTGWLSIVIADTAGNFITAIQGRAGGATAFNNSRTYHTGAQSNGFISVFFPIIASLSKTVLIKASSLMQMRFYYCLGNV